jgi:hypothetical protein
MGDRPSPPGGAVRPIRPDEARLAADSSAPCRMNIASSSLMDRATAPGSILMFTHALCRRAFRAFAASISLVGLPRSVTYCSLRPRAPAL